MKALVVAAREEVRQRLSDCLANSGVDLIQYWHPIKAMDNLEELAPELVFFSAQDFPRHWKPFLVFLRVDHPKNEVPFILLYGSPLSPEEVSKANFLDANDIVAETLDSDRDSNLVRQTVGAREAGKPAAPPAREVGTYVPIATEGAELVFTHPGNHRLVGGTISKITPDDFAFVAASSEDVDLARGTLVADASLRFNNQIHSVDFEVVNVTNETVTCFFHKVPTALSAAFSSVLTT